MAKAKKRSNRLKPGVYFELVGKVNIVEVERGKRTKRTPLEAETVLEAILYCVKRGMELDR